MQAAHVINYKAFCSSHHGSIIPWQREFLAFSHRPLSWDFRCISRVNGERFAQSEASETRKPIIEFRNMLTNTFLIQIGQSYTQSNNKCSLHKRTMLLVLSESLKSMWCNVIAEMRRNRYEIYVCNVQIVSIPIYDCANFSVYIFLFPHLIRKCDRRDSKQQMGQACGMCTCTKCINKSLLCQKNMCIRPSYP